MATFDSNDEASSAAGAIEEHPPNPARPANRIVPDAVARRFLRIDDRYFFSDRTLAFVDAGTRLKVRTHNLEVVHSIVAIIQARGWQSVRLTGTQEFRRKLWHEATLQGIGVQGYEPDALEMQLLQRALDRDQAARQAREPSSAQAGADLERRESTEAPRRARDGLRAPTVGVLRAHAAAPYQFDPMQRMSYYVRVQTEVGDRTLWGADLERALSESRSGARVGDEVVLQQRGARAVTVRVPDRNAQGELAGDKKVRAQRMAWSIEKPQYVQSLQRKATMIRSDANAAPAVLSEFPDLMPAFAGIQLAQQFARRLTASAADQARVVQAIRAGLADAIAQGREIRLPPRRERETPPQPQPHPHSISHHRGRAEPVVDDPGRGRT